MKHKICRQHGGIRNTKLLNSTSANTNLNDPWLRKLDHNSFLSCWKLSESKTFNNNLCNTTCISIDIKI